MQVLAKNGRDKCIGFANGRMVEVPNGTDMLVASIIGDVVHACLPHPTGNFYAEVIVMQKEDFPGIY